MKGFLKRLLGDTRGSTLMIAAAAMPLVIGSAGLAADTIQWTLWKRQLQRAADSAAMAGVYMIVQKEGDRSDVATSVDADLVINNHVGITTSRTIGAPTSGTYAADPYAVQVRLVTQKALPFSSMFMTAAPTITAAATATVVPSGKYCVVSLEDTAETGINASGSTHLDLGCGMITNSTSMSAAVATGSAFVRASPVAAVGGIPASTNWGAGTVLQPFTVEQADPYSKVYPPTVPTPCSPLDIQNNTTASYGTDVNSVTCFSSLTIAGNVTLKGQIIINGGNVRIGTDANVTCNECTIILTNSDASSTAPIGNLEVVGAPTMHFTAPRSGPFDGLLVYQDRRAIDGAKLSNSANYINKIRGSSTSFFEGALYFPRQQLEFEGNTGMNTECVQMVSRRVIFTGSSTIKNLCDGGSGDLSFEGKKVRLVG